MYTYTHAHTHTHTHTRARARAHSHTCANGHGRPDHLLCKDRAIVSLHTALDNCATNNTEYLLLHTKEKQRQERTTSMISIAPGRMKDDTRKGMIPKDTVQIRSTCTETDVPETNRTTVPVGHRHPENSF